LGAVGQFLERATQASQGMPPEATPLLMDLLKFGVTGYRVGRVLEGEFDNVADAIKEQAKQPKQPKQDPEMMKIQMEAQARQAELQNETQMREQEIQLEAQKQEAQAQNDMKERQHKAELDQALEKQRLEFDAWKSKLDNETKILIAELQAKTTLKQQHMQANPQLDPLLDIDLDGNAHLTDEITSVLSAVNQNVAELINANHMHNQDLAMKQEMAHQALVEQMTRPKTVVRDANGKIVGVK
jgi:hypothetical protein